MNPFQSEDGVYIIAEIGGNHEGDFDYAVHLTELAAQSGANAIKFQIYTGDSLVNPRYDPQRNEHFKKFQLDPNQYLELARITQSFNLTFMASVWDPLALRWIEIGRAHV